MVGGRITPITSSVRFAPLRDSRTHVAGLGKPDGNPTRIVTEEGTTEQYTAVRFIYDGGRRVAAVAGESWTADGACGQPGDYQRLYVREFRYEYDEPRAKYLVAERDCENSATVLSQTWTDYLGGSVYGDYEVGESEGNPVYTELASFMPGIGSTTLANLTSIKYEHADHLGTLRALSDYAGDDEHHVVYTAFGERIAGPNHRYGYVGALGYRAHEDFACDSEADPYAFAYLHVGFRYYDPATGRFLQRDPIGISGGLNVYDYIGGSPAQRVDPTGLRWWKRIGGSILAGLGCTYMYDVYLDRWYKVRDKALRTAITEKILIDARENDPKPDQTNIIDPSIIGSSSITVIIYIRLPDGRISVSYCYDGHCDQFYITEDCVLPASVYEPFCQVRYGQPQTDGGLEGG